jgi:hypothetical protein
MSLKRKTEQAFKSLVSAAGIAYGGQVNLGQEGIDGETGTRTLPCVCINAQERGDACLERDGSTLGLKRVLVQVAVMDSVDVSDTIADPEASHAANVDKVTDAIQIDTLAPDLAAAVADFGVVAAMPVDPPEPEPNARAFVTWFAWEVIACETDI